MHQRFKLFHYAMSSLLHDLTGHSTQAAKVQRRAQKGY
jgi:hypothetical protein